MFRQIVSFILLVVPIVICAQVEESSFVCPPRDARPSTYWEWMNGNINKEGLTLDLEYMKQANYGAAMIFDVGVGIPHGEVDYNSQEWKDAIIHALKEAKRLDMQIFMHNSPGYSGTGGPWIPVELSMKQLVWTDCFVSANGKENIDIYLPRPPKKLNFYRDAYVLAYPSLPREKAFRELIDEIIVGEENINKDILTDNDWTTSLRLESKDTLLLVLTEPYTMQSATIYRGERESPLDPHDGPRDYPPTLTLEASMDGVHFTRLGTFNSPILREMDAPSALSFPLTQACYVRISTSRGTNISDLDIHTAPHLTDYVAKINATNAPVALTDNPQQVDDEYLIHSEDVVDITDYVDADGHLHWLAPKGQWTIVRIGFTTTGEEVAAAPDTGRGLECDKMSRKGVDHHFEEFLDPLFEELRPWCGTTLEGLVIDSWEAGKQNWSDELPTYFTSHRGYDITPYLLATTGRIIDSVDTTERFLWDFRRTLSDMFIENYVEHFKERSARWGLRYAGEAYGDGNFESLEMASRQDYPMSEFWTHYIYGNISTTMLASSVGHVWDKPLIACECYTGTPFNSKFTEQPYGMKALGDYIMSAGVNRFVYHATTHQPYVGEQQGNIMTMGPFGTHFDRMSMRPEQFGAFNLYVARCSYMLQEGKYVADVLYLKDEAISSGVNNYNLNYPSTPFGYRWDITDVEALHKRLSVKNGKIVLPDGMTYSILVVTPMARTSPETLQKVIELVEQGMTVVLTCDKPIGYLGLNEEKDYQVKRLAEYLWTAETIGKGKIYHKGELSDILREENIIPDFSFTSEHKDAQIHFIHRTANGDEVYFVSNHCRRPERLTLCFRETDKVPELWDAETGETGIPIDYERTDRLTKLNLTLNECGSIFVVFRNGTDNATHIEEVSTFEDGYTPHSTFTLSTWAKPETFAYGTRGCLIYPANDAVGREARVGVAMGQNGVKIIERNENRWNVVVDYPQAIEGWTHIAIVYDDDVPQLYLNGQQVAVGKKSNFECVPSVDTAMDQDMWIYSFEGDQTKTEVYDYALAPDEVQNIFAMGLPLPHHEGKVLLEIDNDWCVEFPAWSKAPAEVNFTRLESFHKNEDFNVRHFSGTATYTNYFTLSKRQLRKLRDKRLVLNLGRVENIAEVSVNGSEKQILWKAPYVMDITEMVHEGANKLEIDVTNLYPNRMIGDEYIAEKYDYDEYGRIRELPQWYLLSEENERERVLFLPWKFYTKNSPLLEAGLLGPVIVIEK